MDVETESMLDFKISMARKTIEGQFSRDPFKKEFAFYVVHNLCDQWIILDKDHGYPPEMQVKYPLQSDLKNELVNNFLHNEWDIPLVMFNQILRKLDDELTDSYIDEIELKWIEQLTPEMSYWAWVYMKINPLSLTRHKYIGSPSNQQECISFIKEEFIKTINVSKIHKLKYIKFMKEEWSNVLLFKTNVVWLNKNDKARYLYAWHYLSKHNYAPKFLQPMQEEDIYYCVFSIIFNWHIYLNVNFILKSSRLKLPSRNDLILRIDKAWKQQEFRNKQSQDLVKVEISKDTFHKLKLLSASRKLAIPKLIKELTNGL
jgi:hypothetical protein